MNLHPLAENNTPSVRSKCLQNPFSKNFSSNQMINLKTQFRRMMCGHQAKRILFLRSGTDDSYERAANEIGYQSYTINPIEKKFINIDKLADKITSRGFDGFVFTSKASIEALSCIPDLNLDSTLWDIPVYTVGKATAQCARTLGFKFVHGEEAGSSKNLSNVILEQCKPSRLLFPGASKLIGGLIEPLEAVGYQIEVLPVYSTTARDPIQLKIELEKLENQIDVVVYFSPSGVDSIQSLISDRWPAICSIAIGQSTAKMLADCIISPSPDVKGVIHCLAQIG